MILNLSGVGFAITGIVLYSLQLIYAHLWDGCDDYRGRYRATQRPYYLDNVTENCLEVEELAVVS